MPAHIHAASMALYAQDALTSDAPWIKWETADAVGSFAQLHRHPEWHSTSAYRRKPRAIRIGTFDVPEPMRVAPARRTPYFVPGLLEFKGFMVFSWLDSPTDETCLAGGLCHATKEAAILHAKALISQTAIGVPTSA